MPRILLIVLFVLAAAPRGAPPRPLQLPDGPHVVQIHLDDAAITPATARFFERALGEAAGARCLVLVLDTPGGLMKSTQQIVKRILASPVPVVVYVAPSGARAASAGVFITMAAHVAAMAPATHIGAAHPVQVGGGPLGSSPPGDTTAHGEGGSVMEQKVVNDAVAWVRSLAELRGRNAAWAASAVTESASLTAAEASEANVVDVVAADVEALLDAIDGRMVDLPAGPVRLQTAGALVRPVEMWWGERLLGVLSDPSIAFLLLMLGFYGLLFEFYTPGWGVGGTLGAMCLMLGFYGLSVLPVNYAGLGLVLLGLGLFVAEAFVPSFGALTLGGLTCLILGGVMLVDAPLGVVRVSLGVVVPVAVATALVSFFLVGRVVEAMRGRVQTGSEAMRGRPAVAHDAFVQRGETYAGTVLVHGELWRAVSPVPVEAGTAVEVTGRTGLTLAVEPPVVVPGPGPPPS